MQCLSESLLEAHATLLALSGGRYNYLASVPPTILSGSMIGSPSKGNLKGILLCAESSPLLYAITRIELSFNIIIVISEC